MRKFIVGTLGLALSVWASSGPEARLKDEPYGQWIRHYWQLGELLKGIKLQRMIVDRDGWVWIVAMNGLAALTDREIVPDRRYPILLGRRVYDICQAGGVPFLLVDGEFFSPSMAGLFTAPTPPGEYRLLAISADRRALAVGPTNVVWFRNPDWLPVFIPRPWEIVQVRALGLDFYVVSPSAIWRVRQGQPTLFAQGAHIQCIGFGSNRVWIGGRGGLALVDITTGKPLSPVNFRLPRTNVVAVEEAPSGLWVGLDKGVWYRAPNGVTRWFFGPRWIPEDSSIVQLIPEPGGGSWILTESSVCWLESRKMTLLEKASYFEQMIRRNFLCFSLCVPCKLSVPGDWSRAQLMHTEKDGLRTALYVISQALRFHLTGDSQAAVQAWESFTALERLLRLFPALGVPASSMARAGVPIADPLEWMAANEPVWKVRKPVGWRDLPALLMTCFVMDQYVARTLEERQRLAAFVQEIASTLLQQNEQWPSQLLKEGSGGRWDPIFVNSLGQETLLRRVLSAEILATYQLAFRFTQRTAFQTRLQTLIQKHGYLANLTNRLVLAEAEMPAQSRQFPRGAVAQSELPAEAELHLPALLSYWLMYESSSSPVLRQLCREAALQHWGLIERSRDPLWISILYRMGAMRPAWSLVALMSLQEEPWDRISWTMDHSMRVDLPALGRASQASIPLLSPIERPLRDVGDDLFQNSGGHEGTIAIPPIEFLVAFWTARVSGMISEGGNVRPAIPVPQLNDSQRLGASTIVPGGDSESKAKDNP